MLTSPPRTLFDSYALGRILQKLSDLKRTIRGLSDNEIVRQIEEQGVRFYPVYLTRLRRRTLTDPLIENVVRWIEKRHDPDFRRKLSPDAIFPVLGETSRDFYFHHSLLDPYEAWEEQLLQAFSGVYLCAPAHDRHSYMPMSAVRRFFAGANENAADRARRSVDIKTYVHERSILILKHTPAGYYHAAEFPLSLLFPTSFVTLDARMVYEGIAIASSNSIRVALRECLARVPKTHAILITPKNRHQAENPRGISVYVEHEIRSLVREDWLRLDETDLQHLKLEYARAIESDYYLTGPAQIDVSPLPNIRNRVEGSFSRDYVYYPLPRNFLRQPDLFSIRPDLEAGLEIQRVVESPLSVGSLL